MSNAVTMNLIPEKLKNYSPFPVVHSALLYRNIVRFNFRTTKTVTITFQ